jgi:hypothetical protein
MSNNDESFSLVDRGALVIGREVPKRDTFTLVIPDTVCFEVTEVGRTVRLDFRRRTLKERVAMWRRRYGL